MLAPPLEGRPLPEAGLPGCEEVPVPGARLPAAVLVRLETASVCGPDLHKKSTGWTSGLRPGIPSPPLTPPAHEFGRHGFVERGSLVRTSLCSRLRPRREPHHLACACPMRATGHAATLRSAPEILGGSTATSAFARFTW